MKRATFGYSMDVVREALSLHGQGLTAPLIARAMSCSHDPSPSVATVAKWVQRAGLARSLSRSIQIGWSKASGKDYDHIRKEALRLVLGESLSEEMAAKLLGVTACVVRAAIPAGERVTDRSERMLRRLWQANLPDVNARRRRRDEVIALRERGAEYAEIRRLTGLGTTTIHRYLQTAGLTRHNRASRKVAA